MALSLNGEGDTIIDIMLTSTVTDFDNKIQLKRGFLFVKSTSVAILPSATL